MTARKITKESKRKHIGGNNKDNPEIEVENRKMSNQ